MFLGQYRNMTGGKNNDTERNLKRRKKLKFFETRFFNKCDVYTNGQVVILINCPIAFTAIPAHVTLHSSVYEETLTVNQ